MGGLVTPPLEARLLYMYESQCWCVIFPNSTEQLELYSFPGLGIGSSSQALRVGFDERSTPPRSQQKRQAPEGGASTDSPVVGRGPTEGAVGAPPRPPGEGPRCPLAGPGGRPQEDRRDGTRPLQRWVSPVRSEPWSGQEELGVSGS
ncbi:hypothetical protein U0070_015713 [Myodes glareolus]|uniref:Uncharacterized protein n=1 Tax=Myodes glareolus TaxID=447135 RepID=A0AAW0I6F3_MYOGA